MDNDFKLVQNFLLQERDRQVRKSLGITRREIANQFIWDLYSLPGSGGSDERSYARRWLGRSNLIGSVGPWDMGEFVFSNFSPPTALEMEKIANNIRSRSSGRER